MKEKIYDLVANNVIKLVVTLLLALGTGIGYLFDFVFQAIYVVCYIAIGLYITRNFAFDKYEGKHIIAVTVLIMFIGFIIGNIIRLL